MEKAGERLNLPDKPPKLPEKSHEKNSSNESLFERFKSLYHGLKIKNPENLNEEEFLPLAKIVLDDFENRHLPISDKKSEKELFKEFKEILVHWSTRNKNLRPDKDKEVLILEAKKGFHQLLLIRHFFKDINYKKPLYNIIDNCSFPFTPKRSRLHAYPSKTDERMNKYLGKINNNTANNQQKEPEKGTIAELLTGTINDFYKEGGAHPIGAEIAFLMRKHHKEIEILDDKETFDNFVKAILDFLEIPLRPEIMAIIKKKDINRRLEREVRGETTKKCKEMKIKEKDLTKEMERIITNEVINKSLKNYPELIPTMKNIFFSNVDRYDKELISRENFHDLFYDHSFRDDQFKSFKYKITAGFAQEAFTEIKNILFYDDSKTLDPEKVRKRLKAFKEQLSKGKLPEESIVFFIERLLSKLVSFFPASISNYLVFPKKISYDFYGINSGSYDNFSGHVEHNGITYSIGAKTSGEDNLLSWGDRLAETKEMPVSAEKDGKKLENVEIPKEVKAALEKIMRKAAVEAKNGAKVYPKKYYEAFGLLKYLNVPGHTV